MLHRIKAMEIIITRITADTATDILGYKECASICQYTIHLYTTLELDRTSY